MMPLFNKFLSTRRNNSKNNTCNDAINIDFKTANRSRFHFSADQVRILLFRECEWRGRKLLYDSVSVPKQSLLTTHKNVKKMHSENNSCPRTRNGLPQESEKDPCDNVSLLSEMIFGTVAMTYRGPLFKIHLLDDPRCIMCTKVFPASDHNSHKQSGLLSDDTLRTSTNFDSNSSNGSTRNTLSSPSSGNFSGSSLRKSSTCSSTCNGWDIDISHPGSTQSLESNSNSSSGFGSLSSLRRRWLRAMSTSLSLTETDEIFGFQPCGDTSGDICDFNSRRHKTRLGLALLIKLTPGQERQMEVTLLEHVAQLEAILNRLCYACMDQTRKKTDEEKNELFIKLHHAASKCTMWLLRLLIPTENMGNPSIWHEILLNSTICMDTRLKMLYCSFQQMCQLLNNVDTKSTNFFISTVVTAILTYHLGWVNTIISPRDKTWLEHAETKFSYNPLWAQLGDLCGALGNPAKFVHTVIIGDSEKATLINAILTFLTYFIRSAIVKKSYEERDLPENQVQEAITILKQMRKKRNSTINSLKNFPSSSRTNNYNELSNNRLDVESTSGLSRSPKNLTDELKPIDSNIKSDKKEKITLNIPKLRKISSLNSNLDSHTSSLSKTKPQLSLKLQPRQDDLSSISMCSNDLEKDSTSSSVKIIVNETASQAFESEKNLPRVSVLDDFDLKEELRDPQSLLITPKLPLLENRLENTLDETDVYFSQLEYTDNKRNQVFFTLGGEEKLPVTDLLTQDNNCQCSLAFNRVPSTSAQLPEGVLRKILQRNFPESSKSIQRPTGASFGKERSFGLCPKCNGNGNYEGSKLLLETPTNATEVLRTCGSSMTTRGARSRCIDSLEDLLEANEVIEMPMPRSKNSLLVSNSLNEVSGFTDTLLRKTITEVASKNNNLFYDSGYTTGLVIQGLKRNKRRKNLKFNQQKNCNSINDEEKDDLIKELREEVSINARFPIVDHTISESVCILADVDTWQIGIISNNMTLQSQLLPVGMSRLVSNMLEAFVYLWTKYRSPVHCLNVLETKLREIWLRSETLAKLLMTTDVCEMSLACLTNALDLDAADIPLLLAVATTHSPQIAQRFGLTLT